MVDLIEKGFEVISIDNCSRSFETSLDGVKQITGKSVKNYKIDLCDLEAVKAVFEEHENIKASFTLRPINQSQNR